jgi:hypothetical protein
MRLLLAAVWFGGGFVAATMSFKARVRQLEDVAFTKGWSGALRYQDERNPEVS